MSLMRALGFSALFCLVAASALAGRFTQQNGPETGKELIHKTPLGLRCLDAEAVAMVHGSDEHLYDHVVSISNQCMSLIRFEACYAESDRCLPELILPYARKDLVLGLSPAKYFRYRLKEKF